VWDFCEASFFERRFSICFVWAFGVFLGLVDIKTSITTGWVAAAAHD
jgi:hypothetical protein